MNIKEAASLLAVEGDITFEKVDMAFKKLASKRHPDKGGDTNEMARINEARAVLNEHISVSNLPATIKQFELCIKEFNNVAREQRFLEKRVEKSEKDILHSATNRLKSLKNLALVLTAISTTAFFLGKDIPKELTSILTEEKVEAFAPVPAPIGKNLPDAANLKTLKSNENKDTPDITVETTLASQESTTKDRDRDHLNTKALGYSYVTSDFITKRLTSFWYILFFIIGVYAGVGSWVLNRKITRIEEELAELLEDLSFKSQYVKVLRELFEEDLMDSWTFENLLEAVSNNSSEVNRLRPLVRYIGSKKITQLLINKGLESSSLIVKHGGEDNNYEEMYSLS